MDDGGVDLPDLVTDLDINVVVHDPESGRIVDVDRSAAELYGRPRQRLRGMSIGDLTPPSTRFTQQDAVSRVRTAATGESGSFEWQIQRANGELRWIRVHLGATTIDGVEYVVAEIEDITEYRAREQRLRLLSRIVRHNLRNRANVLMGYADRISRAIEDEALEEEIETIMDVTTEVGTLSDSVRQLEEIAEPDATERTIVDLGELVAPVVADFREEYPEVDLSYEASPGVHVVADQGLEYAIEHAIENAIVHNDQATPTVSVSVSEDTGRKNGKVQVRDNGPPIPESEIRVLEADVESSSTYHGSGVGLWIIQWCVDSLGGELRFGENEPRGNVLDVFLPRSDAVSG
ncbi:ATP-binding protein [Halolamina litorea]|uniref:histidine kinase n=1 Tax=Halolamina litorea TaxID=1515593 RepID=A0ABD6BRY8_9EURY|nr:PAS domain-containing sensor histidine kinase [Halolamina litorea]